MKQAVQQLAKLKDKLEIAEDMLHDMREEMRFGVMASKMKTVEMVEALRIISKRDSIEMKASANYNQVNHTAETHFCWVIADRLEKLENKLETAEDMLDDMRAEMRLAPGHLV